MKILIVYTYSEPNIGIFYITDPKYDTPSQYKINNCTTIDVIELCDDNYYRKNPLPKAFFEICYHYYDNEIKTCDTEWFYCTYAQAITTFWLAHNKKCNLTIDYISEYGLRVKYKQYISPVKHYLGKAETNLLSCVEPSTKNLVISLLSYDIGHNTVPEELELNENMRLSENEYSIPSILELGKEIINEYKKYYKRVENTKFKESDNLLDSIKTVQTDKVCRAIAEMCCVVNKPLVTPFHIYSMLIDRTIPKTLHDKIQDVLFKISDLEAELQLPI